MITGVEECRSDDDCDYFREFSCDCEYVDGVGAAASVKFVLSLA
jgi:hypothetical protein